MRLLAVCESPPNVDARFGDGSTLISAELLGRLPADVEIDLVYFDDRPVQPPHALLERCRRVSVVPLATLTSGLVGSLPRGTRRRRTHEARRVVSSAARRADVVYLHSLHTFAFATEVGRPVVVHEVDPWSLYWRERSARRRGVGHVYDIAQAARAEKLERATAGVASRYLLVSPDDACALGRSLARSVDVLPNGVACARLGFSDAARIQDAEPDLIGFVGSLDYAPNIEAAIMLARDVLPRVAAEVPGVRLLLAGRHPTEEIRRLASDRIEVAADVPDIRDAYARPSVLVYPGTFGRGRKNTVVEALAARRPVVASTSAARCVERGDHIVVANGAEAVASETIRLLTDAEARGFMSGAAATYAASLPSWTEVAERFAQMLREAA